MRRIVIALAALALSWPASASDNYQVKDASGATVTIKSKDTGAGVESPQVVPSDASGNPCTAAAGGSSTCVLNVQGATGGTVLGVAIGGSTVTLPVNVNNGVTQSGTWTVQPGNTANTTPWLSTINQGGNSAIVAAGASPFGAALAVAGGITPATATSTAPLSSPTLAAIVSPGSFVGALGTLNIPTMTTGGGTYVIGLGGTNYHFNSAVNSSNSTLMVTGSHILNSLIVINTTTQGFSGLKLYDTATAPTCSSATGIVATLPVATAQTAGYQFTLPDAASRTFLSGIGFCIVGGALPFTDTSSTVMPAAGVHVHAVYN